MGRARLYIEELKALPRARFALAGAAILGVVLTALAIVTGAVEAGIYGYGLLVYVAVPSTLAALTAADIAGARSSRFVEALFTAPVSKVHFLTAKILVNLTVGFLYLLATTPFLAIYAYHAEVPDVLLRFLPVGAGIVLVAVAVGTFLGVLFTARGVAAPTSMAIGVMLLFDFTIPLLPLAAGAAAEGGPDAFVRIAHLSPVSHLLGAGGLIGIYAPSAPGRAVAAVTVLVAGLLALAAWAFLRMQSVQTWETTPARRILLAVAAVLVLTAPAAVASTGYEPTSREAQAPLMVADSGLSATFVPRGAPLSSARFGYISTNPDTIPVNEPTPMDLLVRIDASAKGPVRDLILDVRPRDDRLRLEGSTHLRYDDLGAAPVEKETSRGMSVLRIPLVVTATQPRGLAASHYNVNVTLSYQMQDNPEPLLAYSDFLLFAKVSGGTFQLALAGAPLVGLCAAGAVARRLRAG